MELKQDLETGIRKSHDLAIMPTRSISPKPVLAAAPHPTVQAPGRPAASLETECNPDSVNPTRLRQAIHLAYYRPSDPGVTVASTSVIAAAGRRTVCHTLPETTRYRPS